MSKITYANKVALNENAEIPNINKITDDDMNEIKTVVNNNDDDMITINTNLTNATTYSTTEKIVGTWIDGKPIYRIVFSVNSIGSGETATIGTINNLDTPLIIKGVSFYNIWTPIPRTHTSNMIYQNQIYIENNTVKIGCGAGSAISKGFVIVEYTKTPD